MGFNHSLQEALFSGASLKLRLPLDGSKCHLFHLLIIDTPEALPHGMVHPITAAILEKFLNFNTSSRPNHSYQSM